MEKGVEGLSLSGGSVTRFMVTWEELVKKGTEVAGKVSSIRRHFEELRALMDKSRGYWLGEAGDKYRQTYNNLDKEKEEILKRLEEHPRDLVAIARKFYQVEIEIEQMIQELPGNVLG